MFQPIILFDIPTTAVEHKAWSPNTWKTRFSLNYKGLSTKTEWVEYPDIEPLSIKYGAAPTGIKQDGSPRYTLPMVYDPNTKTAVAESAEIAKYLDKTYPDTPALFPSGTVALQTAMLDSIWASVASPLFMNIAYDQSLTLNPVSCDFVQRVVEVLFNKKAEDLVGEANWEAMEAGLAKMRGWLSANGPGKGGLFMGDRICFADFALASQLLWAKVIWGENSEKWKRIAGWHDGKWKAMLDEFAQYTFVDKM